MQPLDGRGADDRKPRRRGRPAAAPGRELGAQVRLQSDHLARGGQRRFVRVHDELAAAPEVAGDRLVGDQRLDRIARQERRLEQCGGRRAHPSARGRREETQAPQPLRGIEPRAEHERRSAREQQRRRLGEHRRFGERRDERVGKLRTVAAAGAAADARLATDDGDLEAPALREVRRRESDHAGGDDEDAHGATQCRDCVDAPRALRYERRRREARRRQRRRACGSTATPLAQDAISGSWPKWQARSRG